MVYWPLLYDLWWKQFQTKHCCIVLVTALPGLRYTCISLYLHCILFVTKVVFCVSHSGKVNILLLMSNLLKVLAKLSETTFSLSAGECSLEKNIANLMCCLAPVAGTETPGLCLECLRARQHSIVIYVCIYFCIWKCVKQTRIWNACHYSLYYKIVFTKIKTAVKHFLN